MSEQGKMFSKRAAKFNNLVSTGLKVLNQEKEYMASVCLASWLPIGFFVVLLKTITPMVESMMGHHDASGALALGIALSASSVPFVTMMDQLNINREPL